MTIGAWRDRAACAQRKGTLDPSLPGIPGRFTARVAAQYCEGCPVIAACAADARENGDIGVVRAGIYIAGTESYQRTDIKRKLERIARDG